MLTDKEKEILRAIGVDPDTHFTGYDLVRSACPSSGILEQMAA